MYVNIIIVSLDECRGYLGFRTITPPPQRFPFGRDNLENISARSFKFGMWVYYEQCHERYCFVTLTFNFKVIGGLLKVRFLPFFRFWPSSHIQKVRSSCGWYI